MQHFMPFVKKISVVLFLYVNILSMEIYSATVEDKCRIAFESPFSAENYESLCDIYKNGSYLDKAGIKKYLDSYDDIKIKELSAHLDNDVSQLSAYVKRINERRRKEIHSLIEDIIFDYIPGSGQAHFYAGEKDKYVWKIHPEELQIYQDNPNLTYSSNGLIRITDKLWRNKSLARRGVSSKGRNPAEVNNIFYEEPVSTKLLWQKDISRDPLTNFAIYAREWFKTYDESDLFPAVHNDNVIVRNEYEIFAFDVVTGLIKWHYPAVPISGGKYYQKLRPPHLNSYGRELYISGNILLSELDGYLVAINVENRIKELWRIPLGEYTLCSAPLEVNGVVIAGLTNTKGEIWFAGFNGRNGGIMWSEYLGLSSFLSPVCVLEEVGDGKVYIATNKGALVCLDPERGKFGWTMKYEPRKYSLTDYYMKKKNEDNLAGNGSIEYDTQFLMLNERRDLLYYKPRESDYLYLLDPDNGELRERIYAGQKILLGIIGDSGLFLDPEEDFRGEDQRVYLVDLLGNQVDRAIKIKRGPLSGAGVDANGSVSFKINNSIYTVKEQRESIVVKEHIL